MFIEKFVKSGNENTRYETDARRDPIKKGKPVWVSLREGVRK